MPDGGAKPGTVVVALLPARTDTELFHRYIYGKAEIRFLKGRVSFLDHGKEAGKPLFGSMICIWRNCNMKIINPYTEILTPAGMARPSSSTLSCAAGLL